MPITSRQERNILRMGELINWRLLESRIGHHFTRKNAPPMRLLVGLLYLRMINNSSYDEVLESWRQSPALSKFCGDDCSVNGIDNIRPSTLSIWERELGSDGIRWMQVAITDLGTRPRLH
jgi:IS5 family transposase